MTDVSVIEGLQALRVAAPDMLLPRVLTETGVADGYVIRPTPIGNVYIACGARGVSSCVLVDSVDDFSQAYRDQTGRLAVRVRELPFGLEAALERALATGRSSSVPFDLGGLSPFARRVLTKTVEIPPGEVRPYAWVAREIGNPRAVRAVGTALAKNPIPVLIPCHRVVRSDGSLGNYAYGPDRKAELLRVEGVEVGAG
jgi:O-6-methylguanine DNA methyltransferase